MINQKKKRVCTHRLQDKILGDFFHQEKGKLDSILCLIDSKFSKRVDKILIYIYIFSYPVVLLLSLIVRSAYELITKISF